MKLSAVFVAGAAAVAVPPQASIPVLSPTENALKSGVERCTKLDSCSSAAPFECIAGPLQKLDNGVTASTSGGCRSTAWTAEMCSKQCVHLKSDFQDEFTACPAKGACSYDARFECLAGTSKGECQGQPWVLSLEKTARCQGACMHHVNEYPGTPAYDDYMKAAAASSATAIGAPAAATPAAVTPAPATGPLAKPPAAGTPAPAAKPPAASTPAPAASTPNTGNAPISIADLQNELANGTSAAVLPEIPPAGQQAGQLAPSGQYEAQAAAPVNPTKEQQQSIAAIVNGSTTPLGPELLANPLGGAATKLLARTEREEYLAMNKQATEGKEINDVMLREEMHKEQALGDPIKGQGKQQEGTQQAKEALGNVVKQETQQQQQQQ